MCGENGMVMMTPTAMAANLFALRMRVKNYDNKMIYFRHSRKHICGWRSTKMNRWGQTTVT